MTMNEDDLKLTITQNWLYNNQTQQCKKIEKHFNYQEDLDQYLITFKNNLFLQNMAFQWKRGNIFALTIQYEVNQQLISSQTINILQLELLDELTELDIQKDETFSINQKKAIESKQTELLSDLEEISSQSNQQLFNQLRS